MEEKLGEKKVKKKNQTHKINRETGGKKIIDKKKRDNKNITKHTKEKKKIKIMIVDDEPDILSLVEQVMRASDYKVISVNNRRECFDILQQGETPDLIILDIMMPVMSGWDVQRRLERNLNWKDIPIIFLTARTTPTAKEMCKRLGKDYIKKPFDINDLKESIKKVLKEE